MNQITTTEFQSDTVTAVTTVMSRAEKLQRWADLIRRTPHLFYLYSNLERWPSELLSGTPCDAHGTAFDVAVKDPILQDAGIAAKTPPGHHVSIADAMGFFELTQAELHEFSCDCGGALSNEEMARRVERIAQGGSSASHAHASPAQPQAPTMGVSFASRLLGASYFRF